MDYGLHIFFFLQTRSLPFLFWNRSGKAPGVARAPGYNPAFGTQKGKKWVVKAGGSFAAGVPISGSTPGAKVINDHHGFAVERSFSLVTHLKFSIIQSRTTYRKCFVLPHYSKFVAFFLLMMYV